MPDIYYVEDDAAIACAVKEYLEQKNCRVTVFGRIETARKKLTLELPDLILVDEKHEGTVLMIRKTKDTNLNAIVRLVLPGEDEKRKNSVMTFYRIRDKNVEKLKKKSEILYSKE